MRPTRTKAVRKHNRIRLTKAGMKHKVNPAGSKMERQAAEGKLGKRWA